MTPFLLAASTGQQDIVRYFVLLWNGTSLAFHTSDVGNGGKNVLQVTRDAGGKYEHGVKWLLANCRGPQDRVLVMTNGTVSRTPAERSSGATAKIIRAATRLEWDAGGRGSQGQSKGKTGGSKGGSKGDGNWSRGDWTGWNWNSY